MNIEESKFNSLSEWKNSSPLANRAYDVAYRRGLIPSICEKFGWKPIGKKGNGYWNLERCKQEALKYKTPAEWQKKSCSSYDTACKNNWLNDCYKHMNLRKIKSRDFWNYENCIKEGLKYNSKKEWRLHSRSSYNSASKNKWLYDCCKHMAKSIFKPIGYWNLERCKEDALKYETRNEWRKKSGSAYSSALKKNWLNDCCKHMFILRKKKRK